MELTRGTYISRNGSEKREPCWHLEYTDGQGASHRIPAFADYRKSRTLMAVLEDHLRREHTGGPDPLFLRAVLPLVPLPVLHRLISLGLLDASETQPGNRLVDHLAAFGKHLSAKGHMVIKPMLRIIGEFFLDLNWVFWTEANTDTLWRWYYDGRLNTKKPWPIEIEDAEHEQQVKKIKLLAMYDFACWMAESGRAPDNPVAPLLSLFREYLPPPPRNNPHMTDETILRTVTRLYPDHMVPFYTPKCRRRS